MDETFKSWISNRSYKQVDVIQHPLSETALKLTPNEKVNFTNLSISADKYWAVTL